MINRYNDQYLMTFNATRNITRSGTKFKKCPKLHDFILFYMFIISIIKYNQLSSTFDCQSINQ